MLVIHDVTTTPATSTHTKWIETDDNYSGATRIRGFLLGMRKKLN